MMRLLEYITNPSNKYTSFVILNVTSKWVKTRTDHLQMAFSGYSKQATNKFKRAFVLEERAVIDIMHKTLTINVKDPRIKNKIMNNVCRR